MKKNILIPILAFVVCFALQTQKSIAQPGVLDHSFNQGFNLDATDCSIKKLIVQPDGKILAAGASTILFSRWRLVRFNVDGSLDESFIPLHIYPDQEISSLALALQQDGRILIATGEIGNPNRLIRLNANGSIDSSFYTGTSLLATADVTSLGLQNDGKIIVAGYNLSNSSGNILRLNTDGTSDTGFDTDSVSAALGNTNVYIRGVSIQTDNKIIVNGNFKLSGNSEGEGIKRLNVNGSEDSSFNFTTFVQLGIEGIGSIASVSIQTDGKIIAAGRVVFSNGVNPTGYGIARFNTDGSQDLSFYGNLTSINSPFDPYDILCTSLQSDGKIIVGGHFFDFSTYLPEKNVTRLNTDGSFDNTFETGTGVTAGYPETIAILPDGKILLATVYHYNNSADLNGVACLNSDGSLANRCGPNSMVSASSPQADGKIIIAGGFTTYNGIARLKHVARINTDGSLDVSFDPDSCIHYINTLAIQPDEKIILGGSGFFGQSPLIRLNGDGGIDNSFTSAIPGSNSYYASNISSIVLQSDGKIIVGGSFPNDIVCYRLNTDGSIDNSFNPGIIPNGYFIQSIAVQADNKIILSGNFASYNNIAIKNIVRLNTDGSIDNSFNTDIEMLDFTQGIGQVAIQQDGRIVINGFSQNHFNSILKRLNTDGTGDESFNPDFAFTDGDGFQLANRFLIQADGKIIMHALRNWADGLTGLFRLNEDGTADHSFQCGLGFYNFPSGQVNSMFIQTDGNLVIAGSFSGYDSIPINNLARILNTPCPGSETPSISISASPLGNMCAGTEVIFTAEVFNGGTLPRYQWKKNGIVIPGERYISYIEASPLTGDTITCILISNAHCVASDTAISNGIIISVIPPITPSISIALTAGSIPVCSGQQLTFTATPVNGGIGPIYQWKLNGNQNIGNNSPVLEFSAFGINDIVTCTLTSDAPCVSPAIATSNAITVNTTLLLAWYLDADGDGYSTGTPVSSCSSPGADYTSNAATESGDCDDSNPDIHPNAIEIVGNNIDDNCNGQTDETVYCMPGFQFASPCFGNINSVLLGSISNLNNGCGSGYSDYSASFTAAVSAGDAVSYTIAAGGTNGNDQYLDIFIDYNNDADFTDQGENVAGSSSFSLTNNASGIFVVPASLAGGNYRVRIVSSYQIQGDPCFSFYGEVEDYTIEIQPHAGPCVPLVDYPCSDSWIESVNLGSISINNTGCGSYTNYSNVFSTQSHAGGQVNYSVTAGNSVEQLINIYVDFNNDDDFNDSGEKVQNNVPVLAGETAAGTFTIPSSQPLGAYRIRIICENALQPFDNPCHISFGEVEDYAITIAPIQYCTPIIDSPCSNMMIGNVTLGTISNDNSGCNGGYSDYSETLSAQVLPGGELSYSVDQYSFVELNQAINIYVDYNNDGDFEDDEEQVVSDAVNNYGTPATGSFTIPANQPGGRYRVRIVSELEGNPSPTACHTQYGEVEDYTLEVLPDWCIPVIDNLCIQGIIYNVELGNIVNSTACEGYADFSAMIATTNNPGQTVNYNISNNDFSGNQVNVYIDYNNNGSFTDADENVASNIPMNIFNAASGSFIIPASLPYGSYRIRITFDYEGSTADPCHVVFGEVEDYTLVVQPNAFTTLNLNLFLEGLYTGSGEMIQAQGSSGPQFSEGIADQLTVELHSEWWPYSTDYSFNNVDLYTDGTLSVNTLPAEITGSYYIVIKHRNSIETWSSTAISFGVDNPTTYDFSSSASQAFGGNQALVSDKYVIYGGDVNQDGVVDTADMTPVDNDGSNFVSGYLPTDVNGDGIVDTGDMTIVDNNAASFIGAVLP